MELDISPSIYKDRSFKNRIRQEIDEKEYYDSNTLYIENNNNSEGLIRSILDQIILTHPNYINKDINPASKYILNYGGSNSICMVYDSYIYDFIFALNERGEELDLLAGEGLTTNERRSFKPNQGRSLESLHPCKVKGQTPIQTRNRASWKQNLRNRNDIALLRVFTKPVYDYYLKNVLVLTNLPTTLDLEAFLRIICPNIVKLSISGSIAEITFDEKYMEASFKYVLLNKLRLLERLDGFTPIYKTLRVTYKYKDIELTTEQNEIDMKGSPYKVSNYNTEKV